MKITILNGNPEPTSFDGYLAQLISLLESKENEVTLLQLRDLPLRYL